MSARGSSWKRHRWVIVFAVGTALTLRPWIQRDRQPRGTANDPLEYTVTSSQDVGEGSLREILFAANRAAGHVRIVLQVDQVDLESPLPPLANPDGMALVSGRDSTVLLAPQQHDRPLIEILSPGSSLEGIAFNAPGSVCARLRAPARVQRSAFRDCEVGVLVAQGAEGSQIDSSRFIGNATGVRVAADLRDVAVERNHFLAHTTAGVWLEPGSGIAGSARGLPPTRVRQNRFERDRMGVVALGTRTLVESNRVEFAREVGILLAGSAVRVYDNGISSGEATGLLLEQARFPEVEENHVRDNAGVGILVRQAAGGRVGTNEVDANGYGLMVQLGEPSVPIVLERNVVTASQVDGIAVLGASPILRGNVLSGNARAGIRIDDWAQRDGVRPANPLLEDNRLANNGADAPVRGRYGAS